MSVSIAPRQIRTRRLPITSKMLPDIRLLWREMTGVLHRRKIVWAVATLLLLAAVVFLLVPRDASLLSQVQLKHVPDKVLRADLKTLSGEIGRWGDFAGYNLLLVLGVWMGGRICRSRYFQRLAVASMMCAVLAGLAANILRFSLGRPRPGAIVKLGVPDGLYGPQIKWSFNSFPSGHTATAFGSAIPLAVAMPVIGVPALAGAATVSWARMYGNQHHPSDVVVAIWLALLFGVPLGLAVRKTRFVKADSDPSDEESAENDEVEGLEMGEAKTQRPAGA
jgi:membrane-associated phospholipid phosphatase